MYRPHREQASSYRFSAVRIICVRRKNCRSWLASDSGLSATIDAGCTGLIASKLAPMYGLAPTVYLLFKHCYPVASMYKAYSRKPSLASGQHWLSSRYADYIQASKAGRSAGINPRRSDLGSMFSSRGWSALAPRWQNAVDQQLVAAGRPSAGWRR
ncbi:hypothetical protein D3C80_971530 [compost metagenome]